jgi:hypothetical protein
MHQRTALYRFFGADDQLLYVGITDRLGERWSTHMRTKPWWPKVRRQTSEWYDTRTAAADAERLAIREERPLYNVAHAVEPEPVEVRLPRFLVLTLDTGRVAEPAATLAVALNGTAACARELLEDLDSVLGDERVRMSQLPALLRALAPSWEPYKTLTGRELAAALRGSGIRVTNTGNVLRLDPNDLRAGRLAA